MKTSLYEKMKKYKVEADSVEDFLDTYYKHNRYKGRGEKYAKVLLNSYKEELKKYGYCLISHHDSNLGIATTYYED